MLTWWRAQLKRVDQMRQGRVVSTGRASQGGRAARTPRQGSAGGLAGKQLGRLGWEEQGGSRGDP